MVVVTSDKGLAGSVNSAVLKRLEKFVADDVETDFICVGRKALDYAKREKQTVLSEHVNVSDEVVLEDVADIATEVVNGFKAGVYSEVQVVYQNFLSTFEQEPTVRQILPLDPTEIHYIMRGIKPTKGKGSEDVAEADNTVTYSIEPSAEEVLDTLIPQLAQIMVYHALLESKACEHSARMVAMKNATDKTKEVVKGLTIKYNKARQAAITAEVSEITAGVEAMK